MLNDYPFDGKEFYGMMIDRSWYEAPSQQFDTLEDLEKVLFEWLMGEQYEEYMKAARLAKEVKR